MIPTWMVFSGIELFRLSKRVQFEGQRVRTSPFSNGPTYSMLEAFPRVIREGG